MVILPDQDNLAYWWTTVCCFALHRSLLHSCVQADQELGRGAGGGRGREGGRGAGAGQDTGAHRQPVLGQLCRLDPWLEGEEVVRVYSVDSLEFHW